MVHRGIRIHQRFRHVRAHDVVGRQTHAIAVGVAHAGDLVVTEVETQSALRPGILCHVHRTAGKFGEPETTHPGLPSTVGG